MAGHECPQSENKKQEMRLVAPEVSGRLAGGGLAEGGAQFYVSDLAS